MNLPPFLANFAGTLIAYTMKIVRVLSLLLLLAPFSLGFAQQTTFQKLLFEDDVRAYTVAGLPDGGMAIAGYANDVNGNQQPFIASVDCEGTLRWMNTYGLGNSANTLGPQLIVASDGDIVCVHNTGSTFAHQILLVKVQPDGNDRWVTHMGGAGDDVGMHLTETSDSGFVVGGRTDSYTTGGANWDNMYLFKVDYNGIFQWDHSYGYPDRNEEIGGLVEADDEGLVFTGRAFIGSAFRAFLIKTDPLGTVLWMKTFGATDDQTRATDLVKTADGGFVLGGYTFIRNGNGIADPDFWLAKTTPAGDLTWANSYGTVPDDYDLGYHFDLNHTGGITMVGITHSFATTGFVPKKFLLLDVDENGVLQKAMKFGVGNDDYPSVARTADGGYALLGFTGNNTFSIPGIFGGYLIKMDENFNSGCQEQIVTPQVNTFNPQFATYDTTINTLPGGGTHLNPIGGTATMQDSTLCISIDTLLVAEYSTTIDTCNPLQVAFTNSSQGNIDLHWWDFGDGVTDTTQNPIHQYANSGTYTCTLTVVKDFCPDTARYIQTFTLQGAQLQAAFSCKPEDLLDPFNYVGERIFFTDESIGNVQSWAWEFGDGNTDLIPDPIHVYDSGATYIVTLMVTDDRGCMDTTTKSLEVNLKIILPNVITPNGDGQNDVLKILGLREYCLHIFDRWGREVFSNECDKDLLWDGTIKGSQNFHQSSTYFYTVEGVDYEDNEVSEGMNVTIWK